MYLNFGKIYDLNFKFNVAYYPIVGSNSILRHALRLERLLRYNNGKRYG